MTGCFPLIYAGDCLPVLGTLVTNSVHSIITDPPYGLSDHSPAEVIQAITAWAAGDREHVPDGKGFMGRQWDRFVPPPAVWDQCYRALRPGGHMAVFAGTRTVDLMGISIRLAGFEVRDTITWMYSCLTADTEILTEHGWRPGIEITKGERVAQWHPHSGRISLAPVLETFRGPWDGPMRVLRNADTDQVLTPNHHVYHRPRQRHMVKGHRESWYNNEWEVTNAGDISIWNNVQLPVAGTHDGPGIGGTDYAALLGWVWTEGGYDHTGTGVRIYQSSTNQTHADEIAALMDRVGAHKRYDQRRTYTARSGEKREYTAVTWFFSGELANQIRADLPDKHPTYKLLWRMSAGEKQAMLAAALNGDGSRCKQTGTWQFYQKYKDDLIWMQTLLTLTDLTGIVGMRSNRPGGAVYIRNRNTTELQSRHLRDSSENYTGEVWCVRVPTGAFVARRNGKVFITGNSGFPKSRDIGKDMGKMAGAEREVIGERSYAGGHIQRSKAPRFNGNDYANGQIYVENPVRLETAPATDAAKQWDGWGTALKPASEPIIVARKPFKGTVANNTLKYGTGGMNIDGCRVPSTDSQLAEKFASVRNAPPRTNNVYGQDLRPRSEGSLGPHAGGRWPSNLVLSHASTVDGEDACVDGCVPGCPVAELDAQTTYLHGAGRARDAIRKADRVGMFHLPGDGNRFGDSGGASRFYPVFRYQAKAPTKERPKINGKAHPTVKPLALAEWLMTLLTAPGGLTVDPFAGTGTMGQAAMNCDCMSILIENDPESLPYIYQRLGVVAPGVAS